MAGASVLAARACLRSGVGKACVYVPRRNNDILQISVPEAVLRHDVSEWHFSRPADLTAMDAVAMGPGLGMHEETASAMCAQLQGWHGIPLLLDADALNILSEHPMWAQYVPDNTVITPHGGEMSRLLAAGVDTSRFVTVKKGHPTHIVLPRGGEVYECPWGNSGMATAGSGDVLTGVVVALMAQGYAAWEASVMGVSLHAMAGDVAAVRMGEHSVTASDIIECIPEAFRMLKGVN